MSDFKAKMYQIQFRLGLCPILGCGSLQRSPDPLAGLRILLLRGGERGGRGGGSEGTGRGGDETPPLYTPERSVTFGVLYLKRLLKLWRARWCKVDSTTATLSCIYHLPAIFTNFSAFRTHLHALSPASIDMNTSRRFLQTGSHHFQRCHHTTGKLPGQTAEYRHTSSRSPVRQLPTATHTQKQTEVHRPCLQPCRTDHLEWTSYFSYFLQYTGTFQTVTQN